MNPMTRHQLENLEKGTVWPCTIVNDRYSGCYSGAEWLAFQEYAENIPEEIGGDDSQEMFFWRWYDESVQKPIGKGRTAQEAFEDLVVKLKKWYSK